MISIFDCIRNFEIHKFKDNIFFNNFKNLIKRPITLQTTHAQQQYIYIYFDPTQL